MPGSPGVGLTSCRVNGPGEKPLYWWVCLASRVRQCPGSGADGNFSDCRKTFPPGGGLPGRLNRFRVETKPGHCRARLAGVWLTSCRVHGPGEKPLYWWVCLASWARRLGSGADGNFSDNRKTFPPGGGLPGRLKRFRVETKPGHCRARLAWGLADKLSGQWAR